MANVRFERVTELPDNLVPGTIYFVKRADNSMDVVTTGSDGAPVYSRRPHVDMVMESTPGPLPVDEQFGRYIATCPLEFLDDKCMVIADAAATNEAVLPVLLGVTLVARARFLAGSAQALIEILQPIIPAPSLLIFRTPAVQDPTLSGVVGTFAARRI